MIGHSLWSPLCASEQTNTTNITQRLLQKLQLLQTCREPSACRRCLLALELAPDPPERRTGLRVRPEQELSLGTRLRRLRESAGLTQEELALRAGLTPNAVSDLERGRTRRPYPHTLRSLADAFGLSEEERTSLLTAVPRRDAPAPEISFPVTRSTLPSPTSELRRTPLGTKFKEFAFHALGCIEVGRDQELRQAML